LGKVDLSIRALQRGRLIEVPMRFSVVTYAEAAPARDGGRAASGPLRIVVPRLDISGQLEQAADLLPYVEELIRYELHLAPFERLLQVMYVGDESLDAITVSARPRKKTATAKTGEPRRPADLPEGLAEACRRLNDEAAAGAIDRAFERDRELDRLIEIVNARARASALLVGVTSVGKTALVHELAHRAL